MSSNFDWATLLLEQAAKPVSSVNVTNIATWMTGENPALDWDHNLNPLNVNAGGSGSDVFPDLDVAADRTASVINQVNMAMIANALAISAPLAVFSAAVVASSWAASHYGGSPFYFTTLPTPPIVNVSGWTLDPKEIDMTPGMWVRLLYELCLGRTVDGPSYVTDVQMLTNGSMTPEQLMVALQESVEGQAYRAKLGAAGARGLF